jgi:hypothetical protein
MLMKTIFLVINILLFVVFTTTAQTAPCLCDSLDSRLSDSLMRYETWREKILIRPECNGQSAQYQSITRHRLMRGICFSPRVQYPCDCEEQKRFLIEEQYFFAAISKLDHNHDEEIMLWSPSKNMYFKETVAQYQTVEKYDCAGQRTTEKFLIMPQQSKIKVVYYPQKIKE